MFSTTMSILFGGAIGALVARLATPLLSRLSKATDEDKPDVARFGAASMIILGTACAIVAGVTGSYFGFGSSLKWALAAAVGLPVSVVLAFLIFLACHHWLSDRVAQALYNLPFAIVGGLFGLVFGRKKSVEEPVVEPVVSPTAQGIVDSAFEPQPTTSVRPDAPVSPVVIVVPPQPEAPAEVTPAVRETFDVIRRTPGDAPAARETLDVIRRTPGDAPAAETLDVIRRETPREETDGKPADPQS